MEILDITVVQDNIAVSVDAKEEYFGYGYPNEFSQSVLNIVNSAKDALMGKDIEDKQIVIGFERSDGRIEVSIKDNAGGVPEEILDEIFEPYFPPREIVTVRDWDSVWPN